LVVGGLHSVVVLLGMFHVQKDRYGMCAEGIMDHSCCGQTHMYIIKKHEVI